MIADAYNRTRYYVVPVPEQNHSLANVKLAFVETVLLFLSDCLRRT